MILMKQQCPTAFNPESTFHNLHQNSTLNSLQETQTTPARRVPLQKFIAVLLVKKFTTLDGIRRFITIFQEPAIGPCPQPDQSSPNKFTSTSILKI
jgi:hypothetical protein